MIFHKYHGLGNDYLVLDPKECAIELNPSLIRKICHRNFGVGSDGILYGPTVGGNRFGVTIYNPDGSEAEKSGNGLRIFSRYLWDVGLVKNDPFTICTIGGDAVARVLDDGRLIRIEMGKVLFDADAIPVKGENGEVLNREMVIGGRAYTYCAAKIGNPHCVVIGENVTVDLARSIGPYIETDRRFPNRTNVQFLEVVDRDNIRIEIWERGAGYTLASGSSSIAAAAVACRLNLCSRAVTVHMPGGTLRIEFTDDSRATMTGPVAAVCDGTIRDELLV